MFNLNLYLTNLIRISSIEIKILKEIQTSNKFGECSFYIDFFSEHFSDEKGYLGA